MEGGTQVIRRRSLTLSDQLSMVNQQSTNLRDLLKLPDSSSDPCSVSQHAIHSPGSSPDSPWRTLRDLLHLHPNANANQNPSPTAIEASDEEQPVTRVSLMALLEEGEGNYPLNAAAAEPQQQQDEELVRVSLMALLEQSERNLSFLDMGGGGEEDEEESVMTAAPEEEGPSSHVCCVCMVRRKGAAFIPCGHTFCRRCSRELHMGRGTCPLCNGAITEVLDIF